MNAKGGGLKSSFFSARLWGGHINQRVSGGRRGAQREARAGVGCKRPQKLIEERAASSSRYTRRPPQCTPPSSSHRKRLPKTGGAASHLVVQSPLSSSETAASPGPSSRGQAHLVWDRTAKVVSMVLRWRVLLCVILDLPKKRQLLLVQDLVLVI